MGQCPEGRMQGLRIHQRLRAGGAPQTAGSRSDFPPLGHRHNNKPWYDLPRGPPPPLGQLYGPDTDIFQLVQTLQHSVYDLRELVQMGQQENRRQKDWFENRILELENQLSMSSGSYGAKGNKGGRRFWPKPTPAPDTPSANEYLKRTSELDTAMQQCTSLAVPGAKCRFVEHVGDLCEAPQQVKVHAVAADLRCGRGVAAAVVAAAGKLPDEKKDTSEIGDVIKQTTEKIGTVYHLVTKEKSPHKFHKRPEPFVQNVQKAFAKLAETIKEDGLNEVAASYVCSGMDRMHRLWVMEQLYNELKDVPVTVHFYNKFESKRWKGASRLFEPSAMNLDVQNAEGGQVDKITTRSSTKSTK